MWSQLVDQRLECRPSVLGSSERICSIDKTATVFQRFQELLDSPNESIDIVGAGGKKARLVMANDIGHTADS